MSEPRPLSNPYLLLYAFFSSRDQNRQIAQTWGERLANRLGVPLLTADEKPDDANHPDVCRIYNDEHDTCFVYAYTEMPGSDPPTAWHKLSERMFGADGAAWQNINQQILGNDWQERASLYWGATLFFGGELASLPPDVESWLEQIPQLPESQAIEPILSSVQPWAMLWQLAGQSIEIPGSTHIYAVLYTTEQADKADHILFAGHGIDLVELTLHKAYNQLQQYEQGRNQLHERIGELDEALKDLLQNASPEQEDLTLLQENLTRFSSQYVKFSQLASYVTELQNTVAINTTNYEKAARTLRLSGQEDQIFKTHSEQLKDGLSQLEHDRIYYQAAIQRFDTGLQAVRADFEFRLIQKERAEAKQEKKRDFLLGLIGVLLGLTQLWPIADNILQLWNFSSERYSNLMRLIVSGSFLVVVFVPLAFLIGIGLGVFYYEYVKPRIKKARTNESQDGGGSNEE